MRAVTHISISLDGNTFRYRVASGAGIRQITPPPIERKHQLAVLDALRHAAFSVVEPQKLVEHGALVFDLLVPTPVQDILKSGSNPVPIATDAPEVPWELLHDGANFLGLKRAMG